jgi:hypothetical protein
MIEENGGDGVHHRPGKHEQAGVEVAAAQQLERGPKGRPAARRRFGGQQRVAGEPWGHRACVGFVHGEVPQGVWWVSLIGKSRPFELAENGCDRRRNAGANQARTD